MAATSYHFKPLNVGRFLIWAGFALLLLAVPQLFPSNFSLSMLSQMGIAIVACLSYNMLLGQGGMLSFGRSETMSSRCGPAITFSSSRQSSTVRAIGPS